MKDKTTLKRLEERAARRPQNAYAEYERAKLDAMTDEQLARELDALTEVLRTLHDCGALGDVLKDDELAALGLLGEYETK